MTLTSPPTAAATTPEQLSELVDDLLERFPPKTTDAVTFVQFGARRLANDRPFDLGARQACV